MVKGVKNMSIKKNLFIIIFGVLIWLGLSYSVNAASLSISTNKSSASPGETINVTVTLSNGAGKITSGGQTVFLDNSSFSYTVTAGNSGSVSLSASGVAADYSTEMDQNVSASASVKINTPATATPAQNAGSGNSGSTSNNNSNTTTAPVLSNLGIRPHDFSGFTAGRTAYTVNVPNDCTSVNLYASSKNGTVSGTGNKTLKEGTNRFSVTVKNSAGSKTYTVSVVRATASGEDVPNVVDGAQVDENAEGIGLSSLEVSGCSLDKEFKSDVYEYTIKVKDDITLDYLNTLREKIKAQANSDSVAVEIVPNVSEDGKATFAIVVKDADKEYARYVINVVKEEIVEEKNDDEKTVVGAVSDISSNGNGGSGFSISNIPLKYKMFIILGIHGITFLSAVSFAFIAYWKSRELAEYEADEDDELEDSERSNELNEIGKGSLMNETEIAEEKLGKTGYRSLKNGGRSSLNGRHF